MYLLDHRQYPRLGVVVPVRPNAQIHFLRRAIFSVCIHQTKERVFGRLGHMVGREGGRLRACHVCLNTAKSGERRWWV